MHLSEALDSSQSAMDGVKHILPILNTYPNISMISPKILVYVKLMQYRSELIYSKFPTLNIGNNQ